MKAGSNVRTLRVWIVGLCLCGLTHGAIPAMAEPLPSRSASPDEREIVERFLARDDVARALAAQGLSPDQVEERLDRMSAEDLRHFADHVEQIRAAGRVPDYVWILLGIFLGVLILGAIF